MRCSLILPLLWSANGLLLSPSRLACSRVAMRSPGALPVAMCDAAEAEAGAEAVVEAAAPEESATVKPPRQRKPRGMPIADLVVGSMIEGTVRSVMSYGAFVNIGAETDGLLHVSQMSEEFVKDANEMFKAGDTVSVRIASVNMEKGQVALSCKEESSESAPRRSSGGRKKVDLSEYAEADEKVFVTGKVNSITTYGAFVTLKEGVDGLVHISEIQEGGVSSVEDVLSQGQEVQVRIVSFDSDKRRIGLSMKPYATPEEREAAGGGRRKPRGGGRGMDDDDTPYQLTAEELTTFGVGFETEDPETLSVFAQALSRAETNKEKRAKKEKLMLSTL